MTAPACTCGPDVRCVECGGCDCPDNPGACTGPGCYPVDDYLLHAEEMGWSGGTYG